MLDVGIGTASALCENANGLHLSVSCAFESTHSNRYNTYRNEKIEHRGCGLRKEICGLFENCNQIKWIGKQSANRTCVRVRSYISLTHSLTSNTHTHNTQIRLGADKVRGRGTVRYGVFQW